MSGSIRQRVFRGTLANLIAVASNQGSTLAANIVAARLMDKEAYGGYAIVVSTLLTVATLAQVSTGLTVTKFVAEFRVADKARAGRLLGACAKFSLISGGLAALLMSVFSSWVSETIFLAPHLSAALLFGSIYLATATINGYLLGALSGLEAFGRLAYAGIWSGLSVIALVSLGAWFGGLNGSIIGLSAANLLRMLIHHAALRRELRSQHIPVSYTGSLQAEKSTFLAFTVPAALSGYLTIPTIWFCNTLLIRQQDGLEQMALFAAANSIRTIVTFLPFTANAVMVSIINNLLTETSAAGLKRVSRNHAAMTALITGCLATIVALLAPYLLRAFGPSFGGALPITYFLIAATLGETLNTAFYQVVQARGNMWKIPVFVVAPRESLLLVSAVLLIPNSGGAGLGAAYLISFLFGGLVAFIIARRT